MDTRWQLKGKRALVTGASHGIGAAIASTLLEFGAEVILVARGQEGLDALTQKWQKQSLPVHDLRADLSAPAGVSTVIETLSSLGDKLDILVNNVGTNIRKKTLDYTSEDYDRIMDTNLRQVFELTRRLHPMLAARKGCVVNIASVAGQTHVSTGSIYGMSKAALIQLSRNLACEWAEDGIRVNAVSPWYIQTPLTGQVLQDKAYRQAVLDRTPLGSLGEPEDVAAAVAFLCLPASRWITGQCLGVDGGFAAKGF